MRKFLKFILTMLPISTIAQSNEEELIYKWFRAVVPIDTRPYGHKTDELVALMKRYSDKKITWEEANHRKTKTR
jgi:hypothetical protein